MNMEQTENALTDIQLKAYEEAQAALDKYRSELETKKYLVDLKGQDLKDVLNYMRTEAPWKFTEVLGVKEVIAELEACVKKDKLFITAASLEALYFYLSRVEGKGANVNGCIGDIEKYIKILKGINAVRNVISSENEKLKEMEFIAASRREGIEPDTTM